MVYRYAATEPQDRKKKSSVQASTSPIMYFNKFFALSTMTTLAAATAVVKRTDGGQGTCGELKCCNQVQEAPKGQVVGINCSPITVVGTGNGGCSTNTVYCENNSSSLVSIGCIVIR
ncbi:hypothetical protein PQX77_005159 [Marasmius sp. AFHP31]|nr:hypothetical protein PQX77_005159 [Marasmius sp. AFHP31]